MTGRWGRAGVRLSPAELHAQGLAKVQTIRHLDAAYQLWRAGEFRPHRATFALDISNLEGPDVDVACGGREPDVDLWEAGERYPTWQQLVLLADLVKMSPLGLVSGPPPLRWDQTSMRYHVRRGDRIPSTPIERCRADAIAQVVTYAPETRPR